MRKLCRGILMKLSPYDCIFDNLLLKSLLQRSTDSELNSEIDEEEADVELAMIERELERYENELQNTEDKGPNQREAEGGEKLIQEALKVRARNSK